ncbi:DUF1758 domain-containing protein [Trichonephila clavipes]|uniref:DUF1758 domain-containing protein n=1 Tax=Trichonephila clavipes TaxID=2585209 RepID=A0A8X6VJJ6_TRICX|nr:DUF1758 domain-containing protein [Trichonephila clavipes]
MKFQNIDLIARKNFVKDHYLCFLCLNNHKLKDCPNNNLKCSICQDKHNYLLHEDSNRNSAFLLNANCKRDADNTLIGSVGQQEISNIELDAVNTTLNSSTSVNNAKCVSFLPTAKVLLYNNEGGSFLFRALLDSGSESSFISENAINILGLKRCNDRLSLSGISGIQAGITRGSVGLKIGSRFCKDQLTKFKPDEDFSKPLECDVILGSNCFFSILRNGRITGSKGQPIAQSTIFGWVVAGKIQGNCKPSFMQSHLIRVENEFNVCILQQFWQTELPLKKIPLSEEEEFCENHFKATYKINNEGRFVVKLPIYRNINQLGNTREFAVSRLLAMENFKSDVELEREYKNFMEEYEKLGHMSPNKELDGKISYFLPHHAVQRNDSLTTKLRVLQPDIFILVRFRVNEIAFTADIKQMYRQILIDPGDRNLQKIVWRK